MDEKVKEAQVWLNKTYGSREGFVKVEENGRTGNAVMNALVRALQIELHMSNITGYFGEETAKNYNSKAIKKGDRDSDNNFVKILQYGLFCKGYNPVLSQDFLAMVPWRLLQRCSLMLDLVKII